MSLIKTAALIFFLTSMANCQTTDFDWLVGKWKMVSEKAEIYEEWLQDGLRLKGTGYALIDGQKKISEILFLEKFGEQWAYIALPNKQSITLFALTSSDSNRFVFENKEHDFPQRIIYAYDGRSIIFVTVDGLQDNQHKSIRFKLLREE